MIVFNIIITQDDAADRVFFSTGQIREQGIPTDLERASAEVLILQLAQTMGPHMEKNFIKHKIAYELERIRHDRLAVIKLDVKV